MNKIRITIERTAVIEVPGALLLKYREAPELEKHDVILDWLEGDEHSPPCWPDDDDYRETISFEEDDSNARIDAIIDAALANYADVVRADIKPEERS